MQSLFDLKQDVDDYFQKVDASTIKVSQFAEFASRILCRDRVAQLIEETLQHKNEIDRIAAQSYLVDKHFGKILLFGMSGNAGVRLHVFDAEPGIVTPEPWHKHRWLLASNVLAGKVTSENGLAKLSNEGNMYKYDVPDKRSVGAIIPQFAGKCTINNVFPFIVNSGSTYAHHAQLAHRLMLTEPSLSAVVTSPDTAQTAAFIEPKPLSLMHRPLPAPLSPNELTVLLEKASYMLQQSRTSPQLEPVSPMPELLWAV